MSGSKACAAVRASNRRVQRLYDLATEIARTELRLEALMGRWRAALAEGGITPGMPNAKDLSTEQTTAHKLAEQHSYGVTAEQAEAFATAADELVRAALAVQPVLEGRTNLGPDGEDVLTPEEAALLKAARRYREATK